MSILNDPNVQAALKAVDADQASLTTDKDAQATAAAALAQAQQTATSADATVAADTSHLTTDTLALYAAIASATGVPPGLPPAVQRR